MSKRLKIIIGIIVGVIFMAIVIFTLLGSFKFGGGDDQINLEFWGVFDDKKLYEQAFKVYNDLHPNVNISYQLFEYGEYEEALINAFAAETGPDIYLIHNTWLPKHIDKLAPMPAIDPQTDKPYMSLSEFELTFVDVTAYDLVAGGSIYGAPLYVDTLALYYNKDLFNDAGITMPPRTWEDFTESVKLLTKRDEQGNIVRSGAAIGSGRNINRSIDIVSMLLLQSGTRMTNGDNSAATFANSAQGKDVAQAAITYYTDFSNRLKDEVYTWDARSSHYSIDAFVQRETAMMFNYSHQAPIIKSRAERFNFGVAPVPQLKDREFDITYANYWAPAVAKQSEYIEEAWRFLTYLMSAQGSFPYINASARPSARRDFIEEQKTDPDLGVFARQALAAQSWFQIDSKKIEIIFADMIEDINYGRKTVEDSLNTAQNRVNVEMGRQ